MVREFATMLLPMMGTSIGMAQSAPSAIGGNPALWAGAEFSDFHPGYSCSSNVPLACGHDLVGVGVTADYHLGERLLASGEAPSSFRFESRELRGRVAGVG